MVTTLDSGTSTAVGRATALFRKRAFRARNLSQQLAPPAAGTGLKKCLGAVDLVLLGIGGVIGAGVFVLTGVAAAEHAGPAVLLSYLLAAFAALLSALSYAEFVVEMPIAGGAYNYISLTFGELTAWIVACNMVLEYTLSCAAVARGFSAYLATLIGVSPTWFIVKAGVLNLDFVALALVGFLCTILAMGTKESSQFNAVVSLLNLGVIVFVVAAGLPYAKADNYIPFAPYGAKGIFTAASVVFFSFIGFDSVAAAAEEVKNPAFDLPMGLVGSLGISAVLYAAMCVTICLMVPYQLININAPFSEAFTHVLDSNPHPSHAQTVFLNFASRLVSFGAVTGIVTSLLVALLGQTRTYVVLGREHLLPPWLAAVNSRTFTPLWATAFTGVTAGLLALMVDIQALAELVSIGTLFVFLMVSLGVLHRRYYDPATSAAAPLACRLAAVLACSLGFTMSFGLEAPWGVYAMFAVLWLAATATLLMLPVVFRPKRFTVPFSPFTPSLAMFVTIHLIGSLSWKAYLRFGVWCLLSFLFYLGYSMHKAEAKDQRQALRIANGEVEMGPPPTAPDKDLKNPFADDAFNGYLDDDALRMATLLSPGFASSSSPEHQNGVQDGNHSNGHVGGYTITRTSSK